MSRCQTLNAPRRILWALAIRDWLTKPLVARPLGYSPMAAPWSEVFDGFVFTRTMRGSDLVQRKSQLTPHRAEDPEVKRDVAQFQGAWVMQSNETNGVRLSPGQLKTYRRTVKEDHYTIHVTREGRTNAVVGRFALDPSAAPAAIDVESEGGELMRGIYRIEADTLTLCIAPAGEPRPKSFEADVGSRLTMTVWKRP
ncbi:MAG: TIGR03067 domain-containing protein [Planctomycetales bacterium]